jgi:hypothetical protein
MQLFDLSLLYKTLHRRQTLEIERSYTACTLAPHAPVVVDGWSMTTGLVLWSPRVSQRAQRLGGIHAQ